MRSLNVLNIRIIALLSLAVMIFTGCTKDGGYRDNVTPLPDFKGNAYEYIKSKPGVYDSLVLAIERVGLQNILADSNITLFAVPNQAFTTALNNLNALRAQNNREALSLRTVDSAHLDTMVSKYLIRGHYTGDSLAFQDEVPLLSVRYGYGMNGKLLVSNSSGFEKGGSKFIQFADAHGSLFTRYWAYSTTGSINTKTSNAIVHEIAPAHVFGFDEFVFRFTYVPPPPSVFSEGDTITASRTQPSYQGEQIEALSDGNIGTKFLIQQFRNDEGFHYLYIAKEPKIVNAYTLTSANDIPERDPKSWVFQASMDKATWADLHSQFNHVFPNRQMTRVYSFKNTTAYKYYRVVFLDYYGAGGGLMQVAEWTLNYKPE